jgi:hypothetical protein
LSGGIWATALADLASIPRGERETLHVQPVADIGSALPFLLSETGGFLVDLAEEAVTQTALPTFGVSLRIFAVARV